MSVNDILGIVLLLVILFVAFRIGAVLIKVALGVLAILIVVWLVTSLLSGQPVTGI